MAQAPTNPSDDEAVREDGFDGPDSTWRKHTAEERNLAACLDQQRANDLSIHLYNAHALKARLRDPDRVAVAKPWQSKQCWNSRDDHGKLPWMPDPHWTAWPLPPSDVPRKGEDFGSNAAMLDGEGTFRKTETYRPSGDLEAELQALMMRKAKDRFRRREWVTTANGQPAGNEGHRRGSEGDTKNEASLPPESHFIRPDLLADDDEAKVILQPSIRHIITKLDDLLIGLHKSRAGHRRRESTSRRRPKPSPSRARSRSAATTRSASRSRSALRRPGSASSTDSDDDCENADASGSEDNDASLILAPKKRRPSGVNRHALRQRDWSEVLGIASMTGWSPAVIDRAAKRCASLFGESMTFRVMPETAAGEAQDEVVQYKPDLVLDLDSDIEAEDQDAETDCYYCPYEDCGRHDEVFAQPWRWRDHLKRVHKLSAGQVEEVEGRLGIVPAAPDAGDGSLSAGSDEEGMVGGVHVDGFLQPMSDALGRGKDLAQRHRRRRETDERTEMERQKRVRTLKLEEDEIAGAREESG